jgi:hypothetical protein
MKDLNPFKVILYWTLLYILFFFLCFRLITWSGEADMEFVVKAIAFYLGSIIILSVVTPFFFIKWFKKYWIVNLVLFTLAILPFLRKLF